MCINDLLLLIILVVVSSNWIIGDVEGMVARRHRRVVASFHHERVLPAADHVDLGDEEPVDVPGDTPAYVA